MLKKINYKKKLKKILFGSLVFLVIIIVLLILLNIQVRASSLLIDKMSYKTYFDDITNPNLNKNPFIQLKINNKEPNVSKLNNNPREIVIINAEHLDKEKFFIANLYEYVNQTDNRLYTIPKNEYVRAYFEKNLTSGNVIDVFVQNIKPAVIEIYEKDSDVVVGVIENAAYGLYYVEVNFTGSNNVFDLKSVDDVTYDYIHDASLNTTMLSDDFESGNLGLWNDNGATNWDLSTTQAVSPTHSARANITSTTLISDNLSMSGATAINVTFKYYVVLIDDNDDVFLDYWDGAAYDQRYEIGNDAENTWLTFSSIINDSQYFDNDFHIRIDGSSIDTTEFLYIDDVKIIKTVTDITSPLLSIVYPANNTNTTNINLNINYTRSDSGIGLGSCWYSNDTWAVNTTLTDCTNITTVTWSEGQHNVIIWVNDSFNNVNSSSVRFTVDTTFPRLSIVYPPNATNTTDSGIDVNYTRSDNGGSGISTCWYSNDTWAVNTTLTDCTNITITWAEGQHNVIIWVNDSANNVNSSSVRFTVDTTPPRLSIVYPANTTNTTDNTIDVNYTRSDNGGSGISTCWYSNDTWTVNTTLTDCTNITTVIWSEGQHNVIIWVNDSFNNVNSSSVRFTVDTTFPRLSIVYPPNATNTTDSGIDVNFTRNDNGGSGISTCWYSNDTWAVNTTLTDCTNITITWAEGQHDVKIWVNDSAGNTNTSSVRFTVDTTFPSINIILPINASNYSTTTVHFNVSLNEAGSWCGFSLDGAANITMIINSTYTGFNFTNTTMTQGIHNVTFACNDSFGNMNSSSEYRYFTVDSILPLIYLESPPEHTINSTSTTPAFSFNVTENLDTSLDCILWLRNSTGQNISYGRNETTLNGTSTTIIANASLTNGVYLWWINCSDGINTNTSSEWNISISFVNNPPLITINEPDNESIISNQNWALLNWTITEPESSNMEVWVYGSNDSSIIGSGNSLLYHRKELSNGVYTYNWSGRVVNPDSSTMLLLHLDNLSQFGENTTFAYDFSRRGNNATIDNGVWNETSKFAGSYEFNGVFGENNVSIADSNDFDMKEYTIMGWFYQKGNGNPGTSGSSGNVGYPLVDKCRGENEAANLDVAFLVVVDSSTSVVSGDFENDTGSTNNPVSGTTPIQNNQWYHFAYVVKSGSYQSIYVNGSLEGNESIVGRVPAQASACRVGIGRTWGSTGAFDDTNDGAFNGTIDEVAIFNRSLSSEEIASYYALSLGKYYWLVNVTDGTNYNNSTRYEFTLDTTNTCTYTSGNWNVDCADYCNISSNVNGGGTGNNFTATGSGRFIMDANLSGFKVYRFGGGCNATCTSSGCIRI